jgi:hypothetical protein
VSTWGWEANAEVMGCTWKQKGREVGKLSECIWNSECVAALYTPCPADVVSGHENDYVLESIRV